MKIIMKLGVVLLLLTWAWLLYQVWDASVKRQRRIDNFKEHCRVIGGDRISWGDDDFLQCVKVLDEGNMHKG